MKKILFLILTIPLLNACGTNNEEIINFIFSAENYEPFYYKGISDEYYEPSFYDDFSNTTINNWKIFQNENEIQDFKIENQTLSIKQTRAAHLSLVGVKEEVEMLYLNDNRFEYSIKFKYQSLGAASFGLFFNYDQGSYYNCCIIKNASEIQLLDNHKVVAKSDISNFNTDNENWNELTFRKINENINVFLNGKNVLTFNGDLYYNGDEIGLFLQNVNATIKSVELKRIKPFTKKFEIKKEK